MEKKSMDYNKKRRVSIIFSFENYITIGNKRDIITQTP